MKRSVENYLPFWYPESGMMKAIIIQDMYRVTNIVDFHVVAKSTASFWASVVNLTTPKVKQNDIVSPWPLGLYLYKNYWVLQNINVNQIK